MRKNLTVLVFAVVLILALELAKVSAQETTVAFGSSSVKDVPSGSTFSLDVTIANVTNLYGWQTNITFNPDVLSIETVTEGPFLKDINKTIFPTPKIENDKGFVLVSSSFYPPYPKGGANGSGLLATVTFKVESGGSSDLRFVAGTKLRSVQGTTVVYMPDPVTEGCSFTGVGGAGFSLPLEVIAGAGAVVLIVVVVGVFFVLKRRKG